MSIALVRQTSKLTIVQVGDYVHYETHKPYPEDVGTCRIIGKYMYMDKQFYIVKRHLADTGLVLNDLELIEVFNDKVRGKWIKLRAKCSYSEMDSRGSTKPVF